MAASSSCSHGGLNEGDSAVVAPNLMNVGAGAGGLRQQSLRLTVQGLAPGQIGSFLAHWHSVQKIWSITRLELAHSGVAREQSSANLYDATIVMSAMYLAGPAAPAPARGSQSSAATKERS